MKFPYLGALVSIVLAAASGIPAFADEPVVATTKPAEKAKTIHWTFSLLPKSLQKKPSLDFHVITEMTAEGKKLTPPTAQQPDYYIAQGGKFTQLGANTPGNEHAPPVGDLERAMQTALAASSYNLATPATPVPRLVVVFNYGSFARFSTEGDDWQQLVAQEELDQQKMEATGSGPTTIIMAAPTERSASALLPLVIANMPDRMDVLQRAELIGGEKFAHEFNAALNKEAAYEETNQKIAVSVDEDMESPFNRFMAANENLMSLVEESFSSCYFVIASAYDYTAMKKGEKVLLWRTKMTVNSVGVSMTESLAPLIAVAGPYFGRDMTDAVTITRRVSREGRVDVGTPTVVDENGIPVPNPLPANRATPTKP